MDRLIVFLVSLIFIIGFSQALDVDLSCPSKVDVGEEFECSVGLLDGEGVYDLKFDLSVDGNTVGRILGEDGTWRSSYYYLKEFIEGSEKRYIELIVGDYVGGIDGVLKLRQGDKREFFNFELDVVGGVVNEEDVESVVDLVNEDVEEVVAELVLNEVSKNIIMLNGDVKYEDKEQVIYESRDEQIKNWAVYGFALFLIFVIVVLLIRR